MRSLASVLLLSAACGASDPAGPDVSVDAGPPADATIGLDAEAPDAAPPRRPKVLLVGVDGVRFDKLAEVSVPNLDALTARGLRSRTWIYALPMAVTVSGPGWSTITSGVWPDKHQVYDNEIRNHQLARFPDVLARVEEVRPELVTSAICGWPQLTGERANGTIIAEGSDERLLFDGYVDPGGWDGADEKVTAAAVSSLLTGDADLSFVYLGDPDEVCHRHGVGAEYLVAIETADERIGRLLTAIAARPSHAEEDWLVIVTTDHGHVDGGGHGGSSWQERQSFIVAAGGKIPIGTPAIQPRNVDIVPTILAHLGVAIDPAWELDGRPLDQQALDAFDVLHDQLGPAVDEPSIPASVLGWTHSPPPGWSIDNSLMGPGGTSEWRGWSFVDEAFWTAAAAGQGREAFVRARGVIAVADPDEWDDVGAPSSSGEFDSTLISPPLPVSPGTVWVSFSSMYLQDGAQKAEVVARLGDGSSQTLLRYSGLPTDDNLGGDVISQRERIPLEVPPGVTTATLRFRLFDAGNNWYWAIDDPRIE